MALITCPACDKNVSAQARSCPACGHPIAGRLAEASGVVTTQETAKRYKGMQLIGTAIICLGVVACVAAGQPGGASAPIWAGLFFLVGSVVFALGRFLAWWNHR